MCGLPGSKKVKAQRRKQKKSMATESHGSTPNWQMAEPKAEATARLGLFLQDLHDSQDEQARSFTI
jgi:hypothetical protein